MKKVFHNVGYGHEGWYVCEYRDYPYRNRTDKPWFVAVDNATTVSKDPDVQALLKEREEVNVALYDEMVEIARNAGVTFRRDENGDPPMEPGVPIDMVVVDEEDGKRLTEALLASGWVHEFIAIGP